MEMDELLMKNFRRAAAFSRRRKSCTEGGLSRHEKRGKRRHGMGHLLDHLDQGVGKSQKQLAEELGIRPQSVSEAIFFLEKRGEVRKEADANDRRVRRIFLTEQGEERKKVLSRMQEEHAEKFFSVLTASEKQTLLSILEKINAFQEEKEKSQCRHP